MRRRNKRIKTMKDNAEYVIVMKSKESFLS
jgi:hypothetical protein